jgi:hypothetical protein
MLCYILTCYATLQVDAETEDESASLTKGGRYSSSSAPAKPTPSKPAKGKAAAAPAPPPPPPAPLSDKPVPLQGWLEKKSPSKMTGNSWQRRYCRVDESTHQLMYYKSETSLDAPQGSIDLKLVMDVVPYEKDGKKDMTRFNVDSGDKEYKMRAISTTEGARWIDGLNEWRDYFLMNM